MENNMQMIDVLKRLAELDSKSPNVIKESTEVAECGMMGMGVPEAPKTPATINITANDGEELGGMLAALMQLAGVQKVGPEHLGIESEPMKLTAEPTMRGDSTDDMRNVIDKLNPDADGDQEDDQEETDEQYDNSPESPAPKKAFNSNEFANQENQPGVGNRMDGGMPKGRPTYESLMADYKKFVTESTLTESSYEDILKHYPKEVQDFKNGGDLNYDLESALWDYHFNNGDIRNYNADASEYIGQHLADYLGVD
jgi:hypothetical protein